MVNTGTQDESGVKGEAGQDRGEEDRDPADTDPLEVDHVAEEPGGREGDGESSRSHDPGHLQLPRARGRDQGLVDVNPGARDPGLEQGRARQGRGQESPTGRQLARIEIPRRVTLLMARTTQRRRESTSSFPEP